MGNWYSKNESGKVLLIFEELDESKNFDTVTLSMLINNEIACLVPCSYSQIDDNRYIKFNVSSEVEFKEFLDRQTTFNIVADLFINMCRSFIELHKYMIDGEALFLETDKMYIDVTVPIAKFIINPILEEQSSVDFKRFFQGIVVQLKLSGDDSRYVGPILSMLNDKNFSLDGFIEGLEQLKSSGISATRRNTQESQREEKSSKPEPTSSDNNSSVLNRRNDVWSSKPVPEPVIKQPKKEVVETTDSGSKLRGLISGFGKKVMGSDKPEKPEKTSKQKPRSDSLGGIAIPGQEEDLIANMGKVASAPVVEPQTPTHQKQKNVTKEPEPVYATPASYSSEEYVAPIARGVEDDDTTQMMDGYSDNGTPKLIRLSTHEAIEIDKDTFNIGRDPKSLNDYILSDGRIGRRHASILYKNGVYYLIDRASKNHTFLNGKMLIANVEYELRSGDSIRFGPEEFTFEL